MFPLKRIIILALLVLFGRSVYAGTFTAATCAESDVNAIINGPTHVAVDGDIILVPGSTCGSGSPVTWSTTLAITVGITLNGQGAVVQWPSSPTGILSITADSTANTFVTGFTFNGAYQPFGSCGAPIELITSVGTMPYRFYGNTLNMLPGGVGGGAARVLGTIGDGPGLIDHNTFNAAGVGGDEWIQNCGSGNESTWTRDIIPGSLNMVFIEDNTFNNGTTNGCCISGYRGVQFVGRHNCMSFANWDGHSDTPPNVGTRWEEIYQNNFVITNLPSGGPGGFTMATMQNLRGGSGVFWGNHAVRSCTDLTTPVTACDNVAACTGHALGPIPGSSDPTTGPYPIPHQAGMGIESPTGTFNWSPMYSWGNDAILSPLNSNDLSYVQIGPTPNSSTCTAQSTGHPANRCEGVERGATGNANGLQICQSQANLTAGCATSPATVTYNYVPATYPHPLQGNPTAATPSCTPAAGSFTRQPFISCSDSSTGAILCFTTNGTTPVTNGTTGCTTGTKYTVPFFVTATSTLQVIAGGTGFVDSGIYSSAFTVTGDQYGGRLDVACSPQAYFTVQKVGSRWWFCTPQGHGLISMSVGGMTQPSSPMISCANPNNIAAVTAKYTNLTFDWAWQNLKRATKWGFNSVGQDAGGQLLPYLTCTFGSNGCTWPGGVQPIPLPMVIEPKPAENMATNVGNLAASPLKDMVAPTNPAKFTAYRGGGLFDVFDPGLATYWSAQLAANNVPGIVQIRANNPYFLAVVTDDSDFFTGAGPSPDFITGKTGASIAFTTLITPPVQTSNRFVAGPGSKVLYTIQQVFSKSQANSPTTVCSILNPCSLRDYLWQKYTNTGALTNAQGIAALNTAWGSNYTTFDSTATQVSAEAVGTGDGSTTVFPHTLVHGNVDPWSVAVSVGGTLQIGDGCPWIHGSNYGCPTNTQPNGTFDSPVILTASSENHTVPATGPFTVTMAKGAFFSSNTSVKYHSTGVALTSVSGTPTTGQYNPGAAGVGTYTFSAGDASASLDFTYNYRLISLTASTINYTTGAVTITFATAPALNAAITVNYQYGGWLGGGTGLMDEAGSGAWVGTNNYCLEGANPAYPTYFSCVGGTGPSGSNPIPNANPNLGADLDPWIAQFSAKYFSTMRSGLRAVSNIPYFGLDVIGGYGAPAFYPFLQGATPYLDGEFSDGILQQESSSNAEWLSRYAYHTQYLGDKPIMTFNILTAQADSSLSCDAGPQAKIDFASQTLRGQGWNNLIQQMLTTPSFNGSFPFVGLDWWTWYDFQGLNQGLITPLDNAYDGAEAVSGTVPCDSYYNSLTSCGGEAATYSNSIAGVTQGNAIWLTVTNGIVSSTVKGVRLQGVQVQ